MASVNKAFIMGRLGQDPELRYTQSQMPVTTLNVATSDFKMGKDGSRQEQTEWHRVVVWGKQAENCNKYLKKGRAVFIEGKIQTRSWEDKHGQKRYNTDIVASNVQFMPAGTNQQQSYTASSDGYDSSFGNDPFSSSSSGEFANNNSTGGTHFPRADETDKQTYSQNSSSGSSLEDIPFMALGEWGC